MSNPYIIIHGLHKSGGLHMVDYQIVDPNEIGGFEKRGSAIVGERIEIPSSPDDPADDNPLREVERKNVEACHA